MKYQLVKNSAWKEVEVNGEMVKIPEDWEINKLDTLFNIFRGKVISKDYINNNTGIYPVYSSATENNGAIGGITTYMFDGEYLTWTTDGVYAGTVFYRSGKFNCTNICGVLKPNAVMHLKGLSYFVKNELPGHVNHIGNSKLMSNTVQNIELYYPTLLEQTAIANILTQQENLIASYNTLIAHHQQRLDYLTDELLSGRIRLQGGDKGEPYTMVRNTKWKEVEVNGEMVEIPEDWSVQNFFNVLDSLDSKRKALSATERSQIKGIYPYWGANSIIDYVNNFLINDEVILLGEDAAPFFDKSKKVAFQSIGKIWPNNHVHVLKPKNANSIYCVYILNSLPFDSIIGVTVRPKLTQKMMTSIKLKMPPLTEQTAIANILTQQENLITQYKTLRDLEQKRFTWLSDALLSGTYRVKELP